MSKALEKVEAALKQVKSRGVEIAPGAAAFWWKGNVPEKASGFGALILYYKLREYPNPPGYIARVGWWNDLKEALGVTGWWLRRFYCGFELGRVVLVKTENKTNVFLVDSKGKKHYYKEDDVSKAAMKLRKKYSK